MQSIQMLDTCSIKKQFSSAVNKTVGLYLAQRMAGTDQQ